MIGQITSIFFDIVTPVFLVVLLGYLLGPRFNLDARSLSRTSYFIFLPAFIFDTISTANIQISVAFQMILYAVVVHLILVFGAFVIAKVLGRSKEIVAAYVMIAVFGNVGNFGLSMVVFRFGEMAKVPATIYFLVILMLSFTICVGIASWTKGGGMVATLAVFKSPAILAFVPSAAIAAADLEIPLFVGRTTGLLAGAMIPTMLFALGVQLASMGQAKFSLDVVLSNSVRLIGGPLVALLLAAPFGLTGLERGSGIMQASMPAAVLVSIIAMEYDVVPDFVTTAVLFSTLASLVTLTAVIYLV